MANVFILVGNQCPTEGAEGFVPQEAYFKDIIRLRKSPIRPFLRQRRLSDQDRPN